MAEHTFPDVLMFGVRCHNSSLGTSYGRTLLADILGFSPYELAPSPWAKSSNAQRSIL